MQMLLETISSSCLLLRLKKANAFDLIAARRESSAHIFWPKIGTPELEPTISSKIESRPASGSCRIDNRVCAARR